MLVSRMLCPHHDAEAFEVRTVGYALIATIDRTATNLPRS